MAIYITGDTHGSQSLEKLNNFEAPQGEQNYVIICGDVGIDWDYSWNNDWLKKKYESFPWITLFVDGNHENFPNLAKYPIEEWHGGKVHKILPNLIHLMRGQYYTIEGKTFFTFGGASSVDRHMRTEGKSWWPQELPSIEECEEGLANLSQHGDKVDYIITHTLPRGIQQILWPHYTADSANSYLEVVRQNVDFTEWYCGHYHTDRTVSKFHLLYNTIERI